MRPTHVSIERPGACRVLGIALLLSLPLLLPTGCGDDGNCVDTDCQTDDDCPGNWECGVNFLLGRVCIAPNAQECYLGSFGNSSSLLDPSESYGPVFRLNAAETDASSLPASD